MADRWQADEEEGWQSEEHANQKIECTLPKCIYKGNMFSSYREFRKHLTDEHPDLPSTMAIDECGKVVNG